MSGTADGAGASHGCLAGPAKAPGGTPPFAGLEPPPGGWRAGVRTRDALPQYPMVPLRGGFPDGS